MASPSFAQLVSLACHDLRTPLATASGFARTLQRLDELEHPATRYVEMVAAAADQLAELLDLLSAAARIEGGRFEPQLRAIDTRELADMAAARLEQERVAVEGEGVQANADPQWAPVCLSALAEAARRHGGLNEITIRVDGSAVSIGPVVDGAGAVVLAEDLRDFGAAVALRVLERSGVAVALEGDELAIRFPSAAAGTDAGP